MLNAAEVWLIWIAIGVCVSIVSGMWPFRRGIAGIAWGAAAAISGALIAGSITHQAITGNADARSMSFVAATAGAFLANILVHIAWGRMARHKTERAHPGRT